MIKQASLAAVLLMMSVSAFADKSQVPVTIPAGSPASTGNLPHSPGQVIAQGYYSLDTCELSLSFLQSVGFCTITVTNTIGELFVDVFDSDCGLFQMILSGEPGLYVVSIQTGTGAVYSGQFMVF